MVVASGCWVHNAGDKMSTNEEIKLNSKGQKMTPMAVLICRDNSHAFQQRSLNLEQPVKIGRSVARARVSTTNAIFDCKVLSRNHAQLWHSGGKFYLQDTRSSNGTFVNNQRLSSTGLESTPREVCSGDIVQFGVDVIESTKKVTHGCIVATLKLFLPGGKEAKASRTISVASPAGDVSLEDLYKLNQHIQEASRREKVLQAKLSHLQTLVENTRLATDQSWKALIDEDRLLARVKTVESQLVACSKNLTEDKIRNELVRLEEEKANYQIAAKEALQKIHQEKLEVTQKLAQLESRLNETEEECQSLHDVSKHAQLEIQELAAKYTESQRNLQFMETKLVEKEESSSEIIKWAMQEKYELLKKVEEQTRVERFLKAGLHINWIDRPINLPNYVAAMKKHMETLVALNPNLKLENDALYWSVVNPVAGINRILNILESMIAEVCNESEAVNDTNLTNADNEQNQTNNKDNENKLVIENSQEIAYDKNELDVSPNKMENTTNYIVKPADPLSETTTTTTPSPRQQQQQPIIKRKSLNRRTLVNGDSTNLDDDAEIEINSELNDDTNSLASDDTWIGFNEDNDEKSVIEIKQIEDDYEEENCITEQQERECEITNDIVPQQKLEVHFASGTNGKDLEEIHYTYRPMEEFADVATALNDDDSSDSIESPNESIATSTVTYKRDDNEKYEDDEDIEKPENLVHDDKEEDDDKEDDEHHDGDYIKTLKPIGNSMDHSTLQTRDYMLSTLLNSLDSLRGDDDHEAQQVVKRELEQLRDWLLQETTDNIINKLKELYYRAKNENQRVQEVNEELVIIKEKYNIISNEKTELLKQYKTLKAQCGDLLNTSYSVPIQYVAPIAVIIVWMLLEKMF